MNVAGWESSAVERRTCPPHRTLDDLLHQPEVGWSWRDSTDGDWHDLDEPRLVPENRLACRTSVRGRLVLTEPALREATEHLPGTGLGVGLVAQSGVSRNRLSTITEFRDSAELTLILDPRSWRGTVELRVVVFVEEAAAEARSSPGLPSLPGTTVWWSPALHVVLDERAPIPGGGFDVKWGELPDHQLYHLDPRAGEEGLLHPVLTLNDRSGRIADVWNSSGTHGARARIRDLLNAVVAAEVMTELAVLADEVDDDDAVENIGFRDEVRRTLSRRFGLTSGEYAGLQDLDARRALFERLQRSSAVRLAERIDKLVEDVGA